MRLIDADAVLDGIEELKKSPWATDKRGNGFEYLITEALDVVADLCVKQAPSVNPQEPCDDAISRQAVLNIIEAESWVYIDYLQKDIGGNYDCHISMYTDNIRWRINDMPSVTPTQNCVENALSALVIEDIKAEINEGIENYKNKDKAVMYGFMCALYIIDKHIEGWDKE